MSDFVKEGYFFLPRYEVWGVKMPLTIHKIHAALKMFLNQLLLKIHSLNSHLALQIFNRYSEIKDDFTNYLSYSLCFVLFDVW